MKTDPMHIYLKETGGRPLRISTARQIPKHFQAAAERCIRDLLDKGVIEKVDYPTGWCSPTLFVPKANNIDVRLVTDFTYINKRFVRPVHPFLPAQTSCRPSRQMLTFLRNWTWSTVIFN